MGMAIKRARPDTRSGRAALTDAGVDGGARADRNNQARGNGPSNPVAPAMVRKFVSCWLAPPFAVPFEH